MFSALNTVNEFYRRVYHLDSPSHPSQSRMLSLSAASPQASQPFDDLTSFSDLRQTSQYHCSLGTCSSFGDSVPADRHKERGQ